MWYMNLACLLLKTHNAILQHALYQNQRDQPLQFDILDLSRTNEASVYYQQRLSVSWYNTTTYLHCRYWWVLLYVELSMIFYAPFIHNCDFLNKLCNIYHYFTWSIVTLRCRYAIDAFILIITFLLSSKKKWYSSRK